MRLGKRFLYVLLLLVFIATTSGHVYAAGKIESIAKKCNKEVTMILTGLVDKGTLSQAQLFDTFYIPIPGTNPKKFHTQYDKYTDRFLQPVLDKYLSDKVIYVIAVDKNGYVPTHNKRFSLNSSGLASLDVAGNRTKRIFNDRTGLAAAKNKKPFLIQTYQRDTGEVIYDYSMPLIIKGRHWGALRVGYMK